jgi:hypothetical protein
VRTTTPDAGIDQGSSDGRTGAASRSSISSAGDGWKLAARDPLESSGPQKNHRRIQSTFPESLGISDLIANDLSARKAIAWSEGIKLAVSVDIEYLAALNKHDTIC